MSETTQDAKRRIDEEELQQKGQKLKARVFISCGQQKNSGEERIALDIKDQLARRGYDPYVAIREQITKGFKENIFQRLEQSEYFIFIDFIREELNGNKKNKKFRGSLFSHQELALAAYLNKPIIAFREKGVKEKDGISSVIQLNAKEFSSRPELVERVISEVEKKENVGEWENNWRDELVLERSPNDIERVNFGPRPNNPAIYYHVRVRNNNRDKMAWKCLVYIEKIKNLNSGEEKRLDLIENKWRGVKSASIEIPPKNERKFDGFYIFPNEYKEARLGFNNAIADFTGYRQEYRLNMPGEYEISYIVYSENFFPARATFRLDLTEKIEKIEFYKISEKRNSMKEIIVKKEFLPSIIKVNKFITAIQLGRIVGAIRYNKILHAKISKDEDSNTSLQLYLLLNHAALVYEGIKTFSKTKSSFEKLNYYKKNLDKIEKILNEAKDEKSFSNTVFKKIRDKIAFHFDRDIIEEVLKNFVEDSLIKNEPVVLISGKSELVKDTKYLLADNMNINYVLESVNGRELSVREKFKIFSEKLLKLSELICDVLDELIPDLIKEYCEVKDVGEE